MPVPLTPSAYVHTNHPLAGDTPPNPAEENSRGRYQTLCHLVADKALSVAEVEAALADRSGPHPISVRRRSEQSRARDDVRVDRDGAWPSAENPDCWRTAMLERVSGLIDYLREKPGAVRRSW